MPKTLEILKASLPHAMEQGAYKPWQPLPGLKKLAPRAHRSNADGKVSGQNTWMIWQLPEFLVEKKCLFPLDPKLR